TVTGTTTFTLNGSAGNGAYTSGGTAAPGLAVIAATNATPIQVTLAGPHGYVTGQCVSVAGVTGNTAANNTWIVTAPAWAILSANVAYNVLTTVTGGAPAVGQLVSFAAAAGTLPSGLTAAVAYYVVASGGTGFQVSTTSGGAVQALTTPGSGIFTASVAGSTVSNVNTGTSTITTAA